MDKWVNTLRSGEVPQGGYALENRGKLCVLGVLCLIALMEGVCDYDVKGNLGLYDGRSGKLPDSVREWAGLQPGAIAVPGEFVSLTWMNDNGWTFTELADLILENYEQL